MLIRGLRQLVFFAVPILLFIFLGAGLYDKQLIKVPSDVWPEDGKWPSEDLKEKTDEQNKKAQEFFKFLEEQKAQDKAKYIAEFDPGKTHREIYSVSTPDKKWFKINTRDHPAYNANLIPNPLNNDTWIVIAQRKSPIPNTIWFSELFCEAQFVNGELVCLKSPLLMPIAATRGDQCKGKLSHFGFNIGPHDARAFYGPDIAFTMYGSNSKYACFGLWIQDLRTLVDWGFEAYDPKQFRYGTELQRPAPYGEVEKNWFMFWDFAGKMYIHYDIVPKRVYARVGWDGKAGKNLAVEARTNDKKCMAKYMPKVGPELESIHQATNSLAITLCKRADPSCHPTDSNTYVLTIFQHKTFFLFHSVYEPYVMLFKQTSPFEVHGISTKPLWISGRSKPGEKDQPAEEQQRPDDHTGMFYVTSVSWKKHGQKYHGYLDDVLFLGFGIEDSRAGAIDVLASDLLQDIGLCSDVGSRPVGDAVSPPPASTSQSDPSFDSGSSSSSSSESASDLVSGSEPGSGSLAPALEPHSDTTSSGSFDANTNADTNTNTNTNPDTNINANINAIPDIQANANTNTNPTQEDPLPTVDHVLGLPPVVGET